MDFAREDYVNPIHTTEMFDWLVADNGANGRCPTSPGNALALAASKALRLRGAIFQNEFFLSNEQISDRSEFRKILLGNQGVCVDFAP